MDKKPDFTFEKLDHGNRLLTFKIIILTGRSGGGGKTFVSKKIPETESEFEIARSLTTRPIREKDVPDVDYVFVSLDEFLTKITQGAFLEFNELT